MKQAFAYLLFLRPLAN